MKFVLRVDDIGWTAEPEAEKPLKKPDRGLVIAKRFHEAFGGLPWIGGVIPEALDDAGRAWLRTAPEGFTIAMHGVTHRRTDGFDSEFRTLSTAQCENLLIAGKALLGVKTRHFIPPFNVADPELIPALERTGFSVIWGQYEQAPVPPRPHGTSLRYVPSFFPLYSATLASMGAGQPPILSNLPKYIDAPGYAVITLHISWELAKCDQSNFQGIRELARQIEKNVITPERYLEEAR